MYNHLMTKEQLAVNVGDHVAVLGYKGIVEKVLHAIDKEWDGEKYVDVAGTESTSIQVNFTGDLANWGQYQHGVYGDFAIIDDIEKWNKYL